MPKTFSKYFTSKGMVKKMLFTALFVTIALGTFGSFAAHANASTSTSTSTWNCSGWGSKDFAKNDDCNPASSTPVADVSINKTVDVASTTEGNTIHYTLTASALGPATSTGVVATDILPSNVTFVSAAPSVGSYASSTGIWTIGDLNPSSTATLVLTVKVNLGTENATITNTAMISESASSTDPNTANNNSSVSITVSDICIEGSDVAITKTVDNANPLEGSIVNYTLTASALGTATSTGVAATDVLPSGLIFQNATASVGTYSSSTGTWTIGDMSASSSATLVIAARVASGTEDATITNVATINEATSSIDTNLANNSSSVSITVQPICVDGLDHADIGITKSVDNANPKEGDTVNYTLTAQDFGPAASTGVVATDTLPSGLTFVSATSTGGSYASSTGTWTIGTLNPSSTAQLVITATVNSGTAGTTITNTATIGESASSTDNNTANNSSTVTIAVQSNGGGGGCTSNCGGGGGGGNNADIAIVKTVDNANPVTGSTVTFTVTVTDNGPQSSTMVNALDQLPIGLATISVTASGSSTYNMGTGAWNIGTLAPNATATLVVVASVSAPAGTTITNIATVSQLSSIVDSNLANNSSSVTLNVQAAGCTSNCGGGGGGGNNPTAEIGIAKAVDNANPSSGDTIHYTLTVSATGPSTSFGVIANDALPSGVSFVSASSSVGSYASSTGVWTIGTLNNGQQATLVITATVTAANGTTITNTGTVSESPTVVDQLSGNNSSSVTINVGGNGGGGGGGGGGTVGVGGGGGSVLGASTSTGQVLGASCGLYLTEYIHPVRQNLNNPVQVKKLQVFLNQNLGLNLPISGTYGPATIAAVNQFQVKYHIEVLKPWLPLGLPTEFTPTSYVYQSTQRWINLIMCPPLNLPLPTLVVDQGGK